MPDNLRSDTPSVYFRAPCCHILLIIFSRKYLYAGFHPKYLHSQKRLHPITYYLFISTYNTSRLVIYNHSKSHIFFNGVTCHFLDLIFFLICLRSVLSVKPLHMQNNCLFYTGFNYSVRSDSTGSFFAARLDGINPPINVNNTLIPTRINASATVITA